MKPANRTRSLWISAILVFLFFVLGGRAADATIFVVGRTEADLATKADEVVLGRVMGAAARWEDGRIVTDLSVVVEETVKGHEVQDEVTIEAPGGRVGNIRMQVIGAPTWTAGERALLFVAERDGVRRLFGLARGKLPVVPGLDGRDAVAVQRNGKLERVPLGNMIAQLKSAIRTGGR